MIIDIHAHTSNHLMNGLHVESATVTDLEQAAEQHGIKLIVLMATYFPFKGSGLDNRRLLSRIKGNKLFKAFGSLDAMSDFDRGLNELTILAHQGDIAGIKLYPGYQDFHPADSSIFPLYQLANNYRLPVMFHAGELHDCCPKKHDRQANGKCGRVFCPLNHYAYLARPMQMMRAAQEFREVKFVISHLANPYFAELRELMAECRNVYTDISGQFVSGTDEDTESYRAEITGEIEQFLKLPDGADRLMFGTDFPIQSYDDSLDLINGLNLDPETRNKILYRNALNVLNLKEEDLS